MSNHEGGRQMKKIGIIVLVLLLFLMGCNKKLETKKIELENKGYTRNDSYGKSFDYFYYEGDTITYGIESTMVEEEAKELIKKVEAYCNLVKENIPGIVTHKVNLYIVDSVISEYQYVSGDTYFCGKEDLESEEWKETMISIMFEMNQYWKSYGLMRYINGDQYNTETLKNYYNQNKDISLLGLWEPRFWQNLNTNEDVTVAKDTALSLTEYIIKTDGVSKLLEETSQQKKTEWLHSIEVEKTFTYDEEGYLNDLIISTSSKYNVVANNEEVTYYMNPQGVISITGAKGTVREFEEFIKSEHTTRVNMVSDLEENLSDPLSYMEEIDKREYYLEPSNANTFSQIKGKDVMYLYGDTSGFSHLLVHQLLKEFSKTDGLSLQFGFCFYLNSTKYGDDTIKERLYDIMHLDGMEEMKMKYESVKGPIGSYEEIDPGTGFDALAYQILTDPTAYVERYQIGDVSPLYEVKEGFLESAIGTDLSFVEIVSFTNYLVHHYNGNTIHDGEKRYSFDDILKFTCTDTTFSEAFGHDYEEVKGMWLKWLDEM